MADKLFYYQILALYGILDILIIYLTVSGIVTDDNRNTMYGIFIFLLAYSIFGLWLLTEELGLNYGLTSKNIDFTNKSGGNIQKLTSWGLILVNVIGICIFIYGIAMNSNSYENTRVKSTSVAPPLQPAIKPAVKLVGGRRK